MLIILNTLLDRFMSDETRKPRTPCIGYILYTAGVKCITDLLGMSIIINMKEDQTDILP